MLNLLKKIKTYQQWEDQFNPKNPKWETKEKILKLQKGKGITVAETQINFGWIPTDVKTLAIMCNSYNSILDLLIDKGWTTSDEKLLMTKVNNEYIISSLINSNNKQVSQYKYLSISSCYTKVNHTNAHVQAAKGN